MSIVCGIDGCQNCFKSVDELRRHKCGHRKRNIGIFPVETPEDNLEDNTFLEEEYIHADTSPEEFKDCPWVEFQDYSWVDQESIPYDETEYISFQKEFYRSTFGESSLESKNINEFVNSIDGTKFVGENQKNREFFQLVDSMNISDNECQKLLDFIHSCQPVKTINKNWKAIVRAEKSEHSFMKYKSQSFSFPVHWRMETFQGKVLPLSVQYIDPLHQIAEKLIDPEIMFTYAEDVKLKAAKLYEECQDPRRVIGHVMSANWAIETQDMLHTRLGNEDGVLIPIIVYEDGVSVGHFNQVTETPCLGTLGNYSSKLMKKNVSKLNFGYLPELASYVTIPELILHLRKLGYSKSKAKEEIKYFGMELRRFFWKCVFFSIAKCWKNGVGLYVLGRGINKVYTCICFSDADDPAQRQVATLYSTACISCSFESRKREKYDEETHILRNASEIIALCAVAQEGYSKKRIANRAHLTREEQEAIQKLDLMKVHPIVNIMNHVPMGSRNHVYIGTLDILHAVIGGPIKSTETWVQRCINAIANSSDTEFSNANAIFDKRVATFPNVPCCPHVEWTTFIKGLSHMTASDTAKERESSGGKGGGYRTNSLVPALIQTYFAIGSYGDILPNTKNYRFTVQAKSHTTGRNERINFNVGNPTQVCLLAIKHVLDFYFNVQRTDIPEEEIESVIMESYRVMYSSMIKLWKLKEALILSHGKEFPDSRKLHDIAHLAYRYYRYGAPPNSDTSPFECYHKLGTVLNWRQTSGIHILRVPEMLKFILKLSFQNMSKKARRMYNFGSNCFTIKHEQGLKTVTNAKVLRYKFTNNFEFVAQNLSAIETIRIMNNFPITLEDYIESLKNSNFRDLFVSTTKNLQLVQKVSIQDNGSDWGQDIYRVGDFVLVNLQDDEGNIREGVAKTLAITEIFDKREADFYFTVHHLINVPVNTKRKISSGALNHDAINDYDIFKLLTLEENTYDCIQTLHHDSVNGPAFVIPCFEIPNRYKFINKKYFDRSGWTNLIFTNNLVDTNTYVQDTEDNVITIFEPIPSNHLITEFFNVIPLIPLNENSSNNGADTNMNAVEEGDDVEDADDENDDDQD